VTDPTQLEALPQRYEADEWENPPRVFAALSFEPASWLLGFVWWSEGEQLQVHLGPLAITFNAWARGETE
jgi:hypothetical protein